MGITTLGELLQRRADLYHVFAPTTARNLLSAGLGISPTTHGPSEPQKGLSREATFRATSSRADHSRILLSLSKRLEEDLAGMQTDNGARCVTVKAKAASFDVIQRSRTLAGPVKDAAGIANVAEALLEGIRVERSDEDVDDFRLRLLGIRLTQLYVPKPGAGQGTIEALLQRPPAKTERARDAGGPKDADSGPVLISSSASSSSSGHSSSIHSTSSSSSSFWEHGDARNPNPAAADASENDSSHDDQDRLLIKSRATVLADPVVSTQRQAVPGLSFPGAPQFSEGSLQVGSRAPLGSGRQTVECPCCGKMLVGNNVTVNVHVNECLQRGAAKEAAEAARQRDRAESTDSAPNSRSAKKPKVDRESQKSIASFFNRKN